MHRFHIVDKKAPAQGEKKKSLASEFVRLRIAGASDADALRILFDMVTTDGPVPEIETENDHRAS